ncbi:MAG: DUF423 domain-containing protein [Planctomycetota bacterium]
MSDRLAPKAASEPSATSAGNTPTPRNPATAVTVPFSSVARWLAFLAALLGASGVALGAYQAHGLQRWLERQVTTAGETAPASEATGSGSTGSASTGSSSTVARRLANAETAVRYQLVHAVALLTLALVQPVVGRRGVAWAGGFMIAGLAGFSGGLWQIVITGRPWHWAIVPAGGLLLILAWLTLAVAILRRPPSTAL